MSAIRSHFQRVQTWLECCVCVEIKVFVQIWYTKKLCRIICTANSFTSPFCLKLEMFSFDFHPNSIHTMFLLLKTTDCFDLSNRFRECLKQIQDFSQYCTSNIDHSFSFLISQFCQPKVVYLLSLVILLVK